LAASPHCFTELEPASWYCLPFPRPAFGKSSAHGAV
jgi:hypothetical protein